MGALIVLCTARRKSRIPGKRDSPPGISHRYGSHLLAYVPLVGDPLSCTCHCATVTGCSC